MQSREQGVYVEEEMLPFVVSAEGGEPSAAAAAAAAAAAEGGGVGAGDGGGAGGFGVAFDDEGEGGLDELDERTSEDLKRKRRLTSLKRRVQSCPDLQDLGSPSYQRRRHEQQLVIQQQQQQQFLHEPQLLTMEEQGFATSQPLSQTAPLSSHPSSHSLPDSRGMVRGNHSANALPCLPLAAPPWGLAGQQQQGQGEELIPEEQQYRQDQHDIYLQQQQLVTQQQQQQQQSSPHFRMGAAGGTGMVSSTSLTSLTGSSPGGEGGGGSRRRRQQKGTKGSSRRAVKGGRGGGSTTPTGTGTKASIKSALSCPNMSSLPGSGGGTPEGGSAGGEPLEGERRERRLARNRVSARLRRQRKKWLVESCEADVAKLEKSLSILKQHRWGGGQEAASALGQAMVERCFKRQAAQWGPSLDRRRDLLLLAQREGMDHVLEAMACSAAWSLSLGHVEVEGEDMGTAPQRRELRRRRDEELRMGEGGGEEGERVGEMAGGRRSQEGQEQGEGGDGREGLQGFDLLQAQVLRKVARVLQQPRWYQSPRTQDCGRRMQDVLSGPQMTKFLAWAEERSRSGDGKAEAEAEMEMELLGGGLSMDMDVGVDAATLSLGQGGQGAAATAAASPSSFLSPRGGAR